jgi:hypothetical protein
LPPKAQSEEFWHALKTFRVPTQFVVYANEGHLIAHPEHRQDFLRRPLAKPALLRRQRKTQEPMMAHDRSLLLRKNRVAGQSGGTPP